MAVSYDEISAINSLSWQESNSASILLTLDSTDPSVVSDAFVSNGSTVVFVSFSNPIAGISVTADAVVFTDVNLTSGSATVIVNGTLSRQ